MGEGIVELVEKRRMLERLDGVRIVQARFYCADNLVLQNLRTDRMSFVSRSEIVSVQLGGFGA